MLTPLICTQCGGSIDSRTMKCPYCDTKFKRDVDGNFIPVEPIVIDRPGIERLFVSVQIEYETTPYDAEEAKKIAMLKVQNALAQRLMDYMRFETMLDPRRFSQIVRGEIRVVKPDCYD